MCVAQAQTATIFMCRYLFKVLKRWHSSDKKQQSQCIYTYMYVCMYVCMWVLRMTILHGSGHLTPG